MYSINTTVEEIVRLPENYLIVTCNGDCSSSSSFGSMAVHSLGVLPPPTVYLAHMGDESVLLYIYKKKKKL